jgi:hypothetical protein
MKDKKLLVYLIAAPVVMITIFLYIFFISEIEISDVIRSIKLKIYIVIGFIVSIAVLHLIIKHFFKEK